MRFSVLIPVYNVEMYLEQCLRSVLSQDYLDFEIILVNDGSTDQSPEICKRFAEKDSRIKYYNKDNEGLLLTRRFSIKHASGEYILFLDSDDFWEPGVLSKLNCEIDSAQIDMICYRYRIVTNEGKRVREDVGVFPDRTLFNNFNKEIFLKEFVGSTRLNNLWIKCVKASIVDRDADYSAFEDKKGEDLLQSVTLIRNANSILYLDDVFVNYRLSPLGRGRQFKLKYIDDYEIVKQHIYTNLVDMNASDSVMYAFYKHYIESLINFVRLAVVSSDNYIHFKDICKHIEQFQLYKRGRNIIHYSDILHSFRRDYYNLTKQRYFAIYFYYTAKKSIKKILSH